MISVFAPFHNCFCLLFIQGYAPQQYIQGGQYPQHAAQYAPSAPQQSAPSPSYPGHRVQQNMTQYMSQAGPGGPFYKVGYFCTALSVYILMLYICPCGPLLFLFSTHLLGSDLPGICHALMKMGTNFGLPKGSTSSQR